MVWHFIQLLSHDIIIIFILIESNLELTNNSKTIYYKGVWNIRAKVFSIMFKIHCTVLFSFALKQLLVDFFLSWAYKITVAQSLHPILFVLGPHQSNTRYITTKPQMSKIQDIKTKNDFTLTQSFHLFSEKHRCLAI